MARTRPEAGPAGSIGDGDLQRWLERSKAQLGARGISAHFGRAPTIGGAPGSTWVTMTSTLAHGRLVRSADGATKVTAHTLPDSTTLLDQRHPHTTFAQLDAIVVALGGTPVPTSGRA